MLEQCQVLALVFQYWNLSSSAFVCSGTCTTAQLVLLITLWKIAVLGQIKCSFNPISCSWQQPVAGACYWSIKPEFFLCQHLPWRHRGWGGGGMPASHLSLWTWQIPIVTTALWHWPPSFTPHWAGIPMLAVNLESASLICAPFLPPCFLYQMRQQPC